MVEAKSITMHLFLWFLFIVIALSLAFWLYSVQKQYMASDSLGNGAMASLKCGGYMFEISDVSYHNNTLSFTIRNTMGETIQSIVIESDYDSRTEQLRALSSGREKKIVLENFRAGDKFAVYPEGCAKFSMKIINLNASAEE